MKRKGEVKLPKKPPKEYDEGFKRKIKRLEDRAFFGSFRRITGDDEIPELKPAERYGITDAMKSAGHLVESHDADPNEEVLIVTQDKKGNPMEQHITLEGFTNLSRNKELFKRLKKQGGWVKFGGPSKPSDEEMAKRILINTAAKIAEKSDVKPKTRAKVAAQCARAVNDIEEKGLFGLIGGPSIITPERPDIGLPWTARDLLGKPYVGGPADVRILDKEGVPVGTDKFMAEWYMDNIKIRMQYAIIGDYLPTGVGRLGWWEDLQKKRRERRRKRRRFSEVEKLLDIFYIDIEDVFDIETLAKEEEFDIHYLQEEPSIKQYTVLIELMQEEGYTAEAAYFEKLKIGALEED